MLLPTDAARDDLPGRLRSAGTHTVFHYVPLRSSPMGCKLGCAGARLPVTDELSARIVRLPMDYEITAEEQQRVVAGLTAWCEASPRTAAG